MTDTPRPDLLAVVRVIDSPSLYRAIGKGIRRARISAKLSQQEVGAILGMTRAAVSNIEAGRQAIMLPHIYNLALRLKLPLTRFLPRMPPLPRPRSRRTSGRPSRRRDEWVES